MRLTLTTRFKMCAKQRIQLSLLHRLSNMRSSSSSNMSLYKALLHVTPSTYDHRYINYVSTSLRHRAYLVLNHIFLETLHKAVCKIFAGMRFGDPVVQVPRLVRFITKRIRLETHSHSSNKLTINTPWCAVK